MKNGEPKKGEPQVVQRPPWTASPEGLNRIRVASRRRIGSRSPIARPIVERGFTLLELIIVIAIVGILAAIAMPNLINTPQRAKEAVLKTNLRTLREVIDQHYGDKGAYPPTLEALVEEGYLRDVPYDPMTGEATWGEVFDTDLGSDGGVDPVESDFGDTGSQAGIIDVFSLSPDTSLDGEAYGDW